jgi:protein-S-isoprenylcysteine O-methyltransferase Ste14
MAWGYLQYRLCGAYLMKQGEGSGFGSFSFGLGGQRHREPNRNPAQLVTSGPYALTRNPMYMGHAIFTIGLVLATRSPFALLVCLYHGWYLHQRALQDERALSERFGIDYAEYRAKTPLWLPGLPFGR